MKSLLQVEVKFITQATAITYTLKQTSITCTLIISSTQVKLGPENPLPLNPGLGGTLPRLYITWDQKGPPGTNPGRQRAKLRTLTYFVFRPFGPN